MKKCFLGCLIAAAILAAPWIGSVTAAIVPLSDLLTDGATIQSGDKIFSDFTYLQTGDMPTGENVNVETIQDGDGYYGIRIQGGFVDQAGGDASDALITFNVSVPDGSGQLISGAKLSSNPAVFADDPSSLASVTETFIPSIIDNKLVVYDFGEGDDKLLDQISFADGYTTLPVQKDIILHAIGDSGAVTMSFVDQTFPQVPEPSSLVLAMGGLLGFGGLRRRRA
jgi:hypothetical protein